MFHFLVYTMFPLNRKGPPQKIGGAHWNMRGGSPALSGQKKRPVSQPFFAQIQTYRADTSFFRPRPSPSTVSWYISTTLRTISMVWAP